MILFPRQRVSWQDCSVVFNGLIVLIELIVLIKLDLVLDITDRRSAHGSRRTAEGLRYRVMAFGLRRTVEDKGIAVYGIGCKENWLNLQSQICNRIIPTYAFRRPNSYLCLLS
jgi:hypothetical protein